MTKEFLDVIDEENNVLGKEPRSKVHRKGLKHRGVYVLIFNSKDKIFIQKRSEKKKIAPLKWDLSLGEHPKSEETIRKAAKRGAKEELNIELKNLKLIDRVNYYHNYGKLIDNELEFIFTSEFKGEIEFKDHEVCKGRWITVEKLNNEMDKNPDKFTPSALDLKSVLEKI